MNRDDDWTKKQTYSYIARKVCAYYSIRNVDKEEIRHNVSRINFEFECWISHQTVPVLESGESGYYGHDVIRFVEMTLYDKPTYFD